MDIYLAIDGQQTGPFTTDVVRKKYADGEITGETLMWKDGMADWEAVSKHLSPAATSNPVPLPGIASPAAAFASAISSATAPSGDWTLADRLPRLGAALLDGVFALICCAPAIISAMITGAFSGNRHFPVIVGFFYAIGILLVLGVQIYLMATRSQTVGKLLLRLRIYNFETRAPADWVKIIILRGLVTGLIGGIPFIGGLFAIADVCFIFRDDRRCIHDLIAGTVVGKY